MNYVINPYFFDFLKSLRNNRGHADIDDLGKLLTAIQNGSRLGFSLVSFLRQAITLREKWMEGLVCGAASVMFLATGCAI